MKGGKRCLIVRLGQYKIEELTSMKLEPFAIELLKNGRVDGNGGLSNKTPREMVAIEKALSVSLAMEQLKKRSPKHKAKRAKE